MKTVKRKLMALDVKWDVVQDIKCYWLVYRSQEPLPPPAGWWKSSHHHSRGFCPYAGPFSHSQTWFQTECIPVWNKIYYKMISSVIKKKLKMCQDSMWYYYLLYSFHKDLNRRALMKIQFTSILIGKLQYFIFVCMMSNFVRSHQLCY